MSETATGIGAPGTSDKPDMQQDKLSSQFSRAVMKLKMKGSIR